MVIKLVDSEGNFYAYIDNESDNTIYLYSGEAVAYLEDNDIYGFNGKHLGWFENGVVWDHDGCKVGFSNEKTPSCKLEPVKGLKELKPLKAFKEFRPFKPLKSYGFSEIPLSKFLIDGIKWKKLSFIKLMLYIPLFF